MFFRVFRGSFFSCGRRPLRGSRTIANDALLTHNTVQTIDPTLAGFLKSTKGRLMDPEYRRMVDFLRSLEIDQVPHSGDKGFFAHLIGVFRDLESWGCERDVCRAGLFHSIYGTEMFRRWSLPLERRDDVRAVIGERAEWIAYVNCLMDRASFDALLPSDGPYCIRNRETGELMEMTRPDFDDLVRVHLCDWLEQVARSDRWDYRPEAWRLMAERLGGVALENYQRVFGAAPTALAT